jgi:ATP-dependent DNA helicase RecQ
MEDDERHARQEAFVRDEVTVMVATIAFGMGIDKSNVRWIAHGDLPRSLEGYYQETGRAARDGEPAEALLLYGARDIASARWHIERMESPEERERAERKLREILAWVESAACRRIGLLGHFGESHPGQCGRCDVCAGEVALEDASLPAQKVLSAAARTGERFGAHHLADILVGNPTDKVLERGHNSLPTYGAGRDRDRDWWLSLIRDMAAAGCLVRAEGRTGGYSISARGRLVLAGKEPFSRQGRSGGVPAGARRARTEEADGTRELFTAREPDAGDTEDLFQCLKKVRTQIARERGVPPYIVFSDRTLRAMARSRPGDGAALMQCPGVGERKREAYGSLFLSAIRRFADTGGCGE